MKTNQKTRTARVLEAAARGALIGIAVAGLASPAFAQDVTETPKTGSVEIGAAVASDASFKAGEYNGLQDKGATAIGNFDARSRTPFDAGRSRWQITGTELGLETRSLTAVVGEQGKYRLNLGLDQLRRNRSDTYQTPFAGTGDHVLTLPASWLVPTVAASGGGNTISARGLIRSIGTAPYLNVAAGSPTLGALTTPTAAQLALVNAASAADLPLFNQYDLFTKRTRFTAGVSANVGGGWGIDASVRPEHKDGVKPMGTVSRNVGGDISTIIPDVVDQNHTQISSSLNHTGTRSFVQAAYYGSLFSNNVPFMSWQNWASATGTVNTMSSAPSNDFHQFNATAGVNLSKTTKLVAYGSYGRNTQNDPFLTLPTTPVVPVTSLNGVVATTAANARLTTRPSTRLNLTANYRFNHRDNQTAIHIFQYADAEEANGANANFPAGNPLGAVLAQNANANRPYNKRQHLLNGEADLRVGPGQWIKGGYDYEKIDRSCNGAWIDCADAASVHENTARAEWRVTVSEAVSARVNYAYGARRGAYNENAFLALVPYANLSPASATGGATALSYMLANGWNGWGPAAGYAATTGNANLFFPSNNALANATYANNNRISELPGMRRFYVADRNRNRLRTMLMWQASDRVAVQGGVNLTKDAYPSSVYGLQDSNSKSADVDLSYALAEGVSADLFYTWENARSISAGNTYTANSNVANVNGVTGLSGNSCDSFTTIQQRNNNNKLDPCLVWSANMVDVANTVGAGLRRRAGKVDVGGHVVYTRQRLDNGVTGGNWANSLLTGPGAPPTTIAAFFIPAQALPTVAIDTTELRLNGRYAVAKAQSLHLDYAYLRSRNTDWMYEGMQLGSMSGVLPTSEQPFNYGVHMLGVSYVVTF